MVFNYDDDYCFAVNLLQAGSLHVRVRRDASEQVRTNVKVFFPNYMKIAKEEDQSIFNFFV